MNLGLLLLAFPLLGGCAKELALGNEAGAPIIFGASTEYEVPGLTRTEYSGKDGSGWITTSSKGGYERIDWVGGTDEIRILCVAANSGQFDSGHSDDYTLGTPSDDGIKSTASIRPSNGNALKWGTGTHVFYAMYPAPGMVSNYAFPDQTVSSSNAVLTPTGTTTSPTATLTGYIPADQNVYYVAGSSQGTSFNEYKANMNYAYMYAGKSVNPSSSGSVTLSFHPLVTTFEFLLQQLSTDPITDKLTKVELSSTKATLTGKFQANLGMDGSGECVLSSITKLTSPAPGNKVTITLPNGGMALSNTPLKINILTLPVDTQTELTLTLWFGTKKRELALKDNGAWISVPARGKIYFQNVVVPGTGWLYYNTKPSNVTFSTNDEKVFGGTKSVTVKSYRQQDKSPSATYGIAWHAEAHEGTSGTFVRHGESGWPTWLTLSKYSGTGSASGETVNVTAAFAEFTGGSASNLASSGNGAGMIGTLQGATPIGSASSPRDLSMYSIYGVAYPDSQVSSITNAGSHTANCYVVSAPGHYCFPIVYGNAIGKTKGNTSSDTYTAAYASNRSGENYHNADGGKINSAYILSDGNLSKSTNLEARVLWQDTPIGWRILKEGTPREGNPIPLQIVDKPTGAGLNCKYIQFYIDPADILPGNIVIALYDKDKSKILWSWHIWVTTTPHSADTDDFKIRSMKYRTTNGGTSTNLGTLYILHCPIGWTPPLDLKARSTSERTATVRIVPEAGGAAPVEFTVTQSAYSGSPAYKGVYYSQTYYLFGRKDPFIPTSGDIEKVNEVVPGNIKANSSRYYYTNADTFAIETTTGETGRKYYQNAAQERNVKNWIRSPHIFDSSDDFQNSRNDIWNSNNSGNKTGADYSDATQNYTFRNMKVLKTIYDPSPAGFSVPKGTAFSGITKGGERIYEHQYTAEDPITTALITGQNPRIIYGRIYAPDSGNKHPRHWRVTSTATDGNYNLYFYLSGWLEQRTAGIWSYAMAEQNFHTAAPSTNSTAWNFDIQSQGLDTGHTNAYYGFPVMCTLEE